MPLSRLWRSALVALAALVTFSAAGCVYLEVKERELVFRPVREYVRTPATAGLAYEDVWMPVNADDGTTAKVHGWWLPAGKAGAPAVLYLHGIRWSLGNNLFRIARWHELGFNVLAIDYRGFGRSDGDLPSEAQIHEDAQAAFAELARREPRAERRFIYGHSLGAAVALDLATRVPGVGGVVAESGFTSLADVIAENYVPLGLLLSQRFEAIEAASKLPVPVLFVHGTADSIVPASMSRRLYEAAPEPKRLLIIEGGTHSNFGWAGRDDYERAVREIVDLAGARAHAPARATRAGERHDAGRAIAPRANAAAAGAGA